MTSPDVLRGDGAVVDAGGAARLTSAPVALAAYRPAPGVITGGAAIGMIVALTGLRRRQAPELAAAPESAGQPRAICPGTGRLTRSGGPR